jgi:hypothetical protein
MHANETFRQALRVRYITYTPLDFVLKEKGSKTCISCSHYYQNWTQFFFCLEIEPSRRWSHFFCCFVFPCYFQRAHNVVFSENISKKSQKVSGI